MIEEAILQSIIKRLRDGMPVALAEAATAPLNYLDRCDNGTFAERSELVDLPAPEEVWNHFHPRLNYPSIVVLWQGTEYVAESEECEGKRAGIATYAIDLAVVDAESARVQYLWFRYAGAVQDLIRKTRQEQRNAESGGAWYEPRWSITGVSSNGLSSNSTNQFIAAGQIELAVTF